MMIMNKSNV